MAPIWALVVLTAIIVVLTTRVAGVWHLRRTSVATENACSYADVYLASARKIVENTRDLATKIRLENAQRGPEALAEPSLGILAADPSLEEARKNLERAQELCPSLEDAYYVQSLVQWYLGDPGAAYREMADYLRTRDSNDAAVASYHMALEFAPDDPETNMGLALSLQKIGKTGQALETIKPHMDEIAELPLGETAIGGILARAGENQDARQHLEAGLRRVPSDREAIRQLFRVYTDLGELKEGADFFMSLGEEGRRTVPEAYHHAAMLYQREGDLDRQVVALKGAVALVPNNAELRFQLGVVLYRLGRLQEAREEVKVAAEYNISAVMKGIERVGFDPRN